MTVAWFTQVITFKWFTSQYKVYTRSDVKPQNLMVSMNVSDATIFNYLDKHPASLYEPQMEPDLSLDPIITVKSQPLPDFDLDPNLDNIVVKLADYGESEHSKEYFRASQTDPTKPFLSRRPA